MRRGLLSLVVAALLAAMIISPHPVRAHSGTHGPDDIYDPAAGVAYNGFKIYLSPAHHFAGPNEGCDAYTEDVSMRNLADEVARQANEENGSLRDRGYRVRVGRGNPDENVQRSNAWGSDRYVALHSNARSGQQCGYHSGGTIGFYAGGRHLSHDMARIIQQLVTSRSPGEVLDDVRTQSLYEVNNPGPNAPPALIETEYHDWQAGQGWITRHETWGWLIASAIDQHLGYP